MPIGQDFVNLDIALGGNGVYRWDEGGGVSSTPVPGGETIQDQVAWYIGTSGDGNTAVNGGGIWRGTRFTAHAGALSYPTSYYWSLSESAATEAFYLLLVELIAGYVNPQGGPAPKYHGFALRCVRDVP